jgi:hypothetical protein
MTLLSPPDENIPGRAPTPRQSRINNLILYFLSHDILSDSFCAININI